ncbi:glycosyltransferase family 4 protein [Aeromicrobium sp.]
MAGGTRSYEMARRFVEAGHEVHVVTARDVGGAKGWVTSTVADFTVHGIDVAYDNAMSAPRRIVAFAQYALGAGFRAARLRPDVVLASSTPLTVAIPAGVARLLSRARVVFEVRDLWPSGPIAMGYLRDPVSRFLARALEKFAYAISDQVVALSPGMLDGVVEAGKPASQVHLVPNASDRDLFAVDAEVGSAWKDRHPQLGDGPFITYAGTFGAVNDVAWLVDLAAEFPAGDGPTFLCVGDGAKIDDVRRRALEAGVLERNLHVLPPIPKVEVPAVLSASTAVIAVQLDIPELLVSSPNKVFDAFAAGRPLIINYGGWQKDLLDESGAGLVLSRKPSEAAAQLRAFLSDHDALAMAGRAGADLARDRFDRDALARTMLDVLEMAHDSRRRR